MNQKRLHCDSNSPAVWTECHVHKHFENGREVIAYSMLSKTKTSTVVSAQEIALATTKGVVEMLARM